MSLFQDVLHSFFPNKKAAGQSLPPSSLETEENTPSNPEQGDFTQPHFGPLPRTGKLTQKQHNQALYGKSPSFIDHLPWAEFLEDEGVMLLDRKSVV